VTSEIEFAGNVMVAAPPVTAAAEVLVDTGLRPQIRDRRRGL
jgi:hypothetical protein